MKSFALLAIALMVLASLSYAAAVQNDATSYGVGVASSMNFSRVIEYAKDLTSFGSRVVGYEGYYRAVEYIVGRLRDMGYSPELQLFKVVAPVEEEAYIEVGGKRLDVHLVWPNAMFMTSPTGPEGIVGKLVYVGKGTAREMSGKEINGSIVLMDFNSGENWLRAADFGAKAVVFLEPDETNRYEALSKFTSAPIRFTRVYAPKGVAKELAKHEGEVARLVLRAKMKEVEAFNIVVKVNGTTYPDDVIVVGVHFDAWSVVPAVSKGYSEAVNPALLLELARVLRQSPPPRSVWLSFLSGFYNSLAGPKAFVEEYFYRPEVLAGKLRVWIMIGLQLSDESPRISSLFVGHGLRFGADSSTIAAKYTWLKGRLYAYAQSPQLLASVSKLLGFEAKPSDVYEDYLEASGWWGTQQVPYMLLSEPAAMAGTASFTFKTAYYRGFRWGIPIDDEVFFDLKNFEVQAVVASFMVSSLLAEETWGLSWGSHSPVRFAVRVGAIEGLVNFTGKVVKLDPSTGWYQPVEGALVRVYPEGPSGTFAWPFSAYVTLSATNGTFRAIIGPRGSTPAWLFDAWVADWSTGGIAYAWDRGPLYGQGVLKQSLMPLSQSEEALIPVFEARSLTVFRVFSPSSLRRPVILDPRLPVQSFLSSYVRFEVYDFDTKGYPYFYGYWYDPWSYPFIAFGQPGGKLIVNIRVGLGWPEIVLVNASTSYSEGSGFLLREDVVVTASYLRMANDLLLLAEGRYRRLSERGVRSLSAEQLLSEARQYLEAAEASLMAKDYEAYEAYASAALSYASKAYKDEVMPLYDDAGKSGLAVLALLIPAAFFFERLILHAAGGRERLSTLLLIGAALMGIFYAIHPALSVLVNVTMSLVGVLLALLFAISMVVLGSETSRVIEEEAERVMGVHKVGRAHAVVTLQSIAIAIENMRKRPLRTVLTLVALIATVIAVTSLTSISYYTEVKFAPLVPEAPANALLVKRGYAVPLYDVLDEPLLPYLMATAPELKLRPRSWSYPSMGNKQGYSAPLYSHGRFNASTQVSAILGLTGEEVIEKLSDILVAGPPSNLLLKLFDEGFAVCLVPRSAAEALNVSIGDRVSYAGFDFTVVGVFDEVLASKLVDLDGMSPAPVRPEHNPTIAMQPPGPPPTVPSSTSWNELIIAPYAFVLRGGGYLASVELPSEPVDEIVLTRVARDVALATDLKVYVGAKGVGVLSGARVASYLFLGWEMIPVVLVIGALNMAITLLGNIKERVREIYVFTAVGLSPSGSALMYVTEALTYAVIAVVAGYALGFATNRLMALLGFLPSAYALNYASAFMIVAFAVLILSVLSASLYPSLVAATLITPSLERRWKPPTKPRGDFWEIPLPIRFPSREEALGSLHYIYEYFTGMGKERPYFTVREAEPLSLAEPVTTLVVALAPYELGVTQEARVGLVGDEIRRVYTLMLKLRRLTGSRSAWESLSYYFIDEVRKQALMWRALPQERRAHYVERAGAPQV